MRAAHVHILSDAPEEDAGRKIVEWAERHGLRKRGVRLFGRNTYPTDHTEPHGYEFFLAIGPEVAAGGDIGTDEITGGLYAVLRFEGLGRIGAAWEELWNWVEGGEYEHAGWRKGKHGWVSGLEEHLDWHEEKPQSERVFDLWLELRE